MSRDCRDAVIEALADSEDALLQRVVELMIERDTYRLIAVQAIHRLHDQHVENERLREQNRSLRDELRRYTTAAVLERRRAA